MLNFLRRKPSGDSILPLYGAIVAQARQPLFYADLGVPDTAEGRFDMILLHLALVMRRLRTGAEPEGLAVQQLFDLFCRDMDHNLREMGVSDLSVPKKMRRLGEAFYGRATAYDRALDSADEAALVNALARNVFDAADAAGARRLADYVRRSEQALARQDAAAIAAGGVRFAAIAEAGITAGGPA